MTDERPYHLIAIGGSAGSFPVILEILKGLPAELCIPIVFIIHRPRNVPSEMESILSVRKPMIEPEDKEVIEPCNLYLAPQNYHLLIEEDYSFSLDYSELVNYSRPSIDVTFESVAAVFGHKAVGILLSGANKDGSQGLLEIKKQGGMVIAQTPESSEFPYMPNSAVELIPDILRLNPGEIANMIIKMQQAR
ncbi:MAG: chemotaxis protein CheB [Sphingobacteriales bacterium]|nr:MAG: chemotaxis protein CheB [Sphingobacteriales bacterium]